MPSSKDKHQADKASLFSQMYGGKNAPKIHFLGDSLSMKPEFISHSYLEQITAAAGLKEQMIAPEPEKPVLTDYEKILAYHESQLVKSIAPPSGLSNTPPTLKKPMLLGFPIHVVAMHGVPRKTPGLYGVGPSWSKIQPVMDFHVDLKIAHDFVKQAGFGPGQTITIRERDDPEARWHVHVLQMSLSYADDVVNVTGQILQWGHSWKEPKPDEPLPKTKLDWSLTVLNCPSGEDPGWYGSVTSLMDVCNMLEDELCEDDTVKIVGLKGKMFIGLVPHALAWADRILFPPEYSVSVGTMPDV